VVSWENPHVRRDRYRGNRRLHRQSARDSLQRECRRLKAAREQRTKTDLGKRRRRSVARHVMAPVVLTVSMDRDRKEVRMNNRSVLMRSVPLVRMFVGGMQMERG
jgi:hypothetical protein